jgi:hypothetical protein
MICESDGIKFKNICILQQTGAALTLQNVKNFDLKEFTYPVTNPEVVKIIGKSENIKLPSSIEKQKIVGMR